MTAQRAWEAVKRELKRDMSKGAYDGWVREAVVLDLRDEAFVVGVKGGYGRDWLERCSIELLQRC